MNTDIRSAFFCYRRRTRGQIVCMDQIFPLRPARFMGPKTFKHVSFPHPRGTIRLIRGARFRFICRVVYFLKNNIRNQPLTPNTPKRCLWTQGSGWGIGGGKDEGFFGPSHTNSGARSRERRISTTATQRSEQALSL
jgi:hypothetical protein